MANKIRKQRVFTVLHYNEDPDASDLVYTDVLAMDEDEAIEYCGGIENVLDVFEDPYDLDEDIDAYEPDTTEVGVSLFTVVHFEDGELLYTDVIASSEAEACSWFNPGDIFDVYEASLGMGMIA